MLDKVTQVVAEVLDIDRDEVSDNLSLDNCPNWTSLAHVALLSEIEDVFDVELGPAESIEMDSVGAIREILASKGASFE